MSQPQVLIDNVTAGSADVNETSTAGLHLREDRVYMTMRCSEPREENKKFYQLLYTVLGNVTETLNLQFDGDTGIYMELENASTTNASVDVFTSDALTPSKKQLKAIVSSMLNQSLPKINKLLMNYTIPFPAQAIPYVPNPQMKTVATTNGGYVQQSWMCNCHKDEGGWQKCQDENVIDHMRDAYSTLTSDFGCLVDPDCRWIASQLNTAIQNYPPIDFECPAPNASGHWPTPSPSPPPSECFDAAGSLACTMPRHFHFFCKEESVQRRCRKSCGLCQRRRRLKENGKSSTVLTRVLRGQTACPAANASEHVLAGVSIFSSVDDSSVAATGATMAHTVLPLSTTEDTCLDAGDGSERVLFGSRHYMLSAVPADDWCKRNGPLSLSFGCLPTGPGNTTDNCGNCLLKVKAHPDSVVTLPEVKWNGACPSLFPFPSPKAAGNFSSLGSVCYVNAAYASAGSGPAWSWCAATKSPEFLRIMNVGPAGRVCPPASDRVSVILSSDTRGGQCAGGLRAVKKDTILVRTRQQAPVNRSEIDSRAEEIINMGNSGECLQMSSFFPPFSRARLKTHADGSPMVPPMVQLWLGCLDNKCSVGCYEDLSPVTVILGQPQTFLQSSGLVTTVVLGKDYGLKTCPSPPKNSGGGVAAAIIGSLVGLVLMVGAFVAHRRWYRPARAAQPPSNAPRHGINWMRLINPTSSEPQSGDEAVSSASPLCSCSFAKAYCLTKLQDSYCRCHKAPDTRAGDKRRFCVVFSVVYIFSIFCGVLWYVSNPLQLQIDLLEENQQFTETYDDSQARSLVRNSRLSGLLIFVLIPLFLLVLVSCCSWLNELKFCGLVCWGSRKTGFEAHKLSLSIRGIGFFEAGLLFALLSLTYWKDFWHAITARPERNNANVFDMLGPSVNAILIVEMLTAWMKPWFIATHVVSWNAVTVCWHRLCYLPTKQSGATGVWDILTDIEPQNMPSFKRLAEARNLVFPNLTVVLLVHLFISLALASIIFRSGEVQIGFLVLSAASVAASVAAFILLCHEKTLKWLRHHEHWTGSSKIFWASQVIVSIMLINMLCDKSAGGGAGFISLTALMSSAASFAGTWHFMRRAEMELDGGPRVTSQEKPLLSMSAGSDAAHSEGISPEAGAAKEQGCVGEKSAIACDEGLLGADGDESGTVNNEVDKGPLGSVSICCCEVPPRVVEISPFLRCACEVPETSNRRFYGARIKWRRMCLVAGAICMTISAFNDRAVLVEDTTAVAWQELISEMESYGGQDMMISPSNTSFLAPIVEGYAAVMLTRAQIKMIVASAFTLSAACDLCRSTRKWLFASRMFGFLGGFGAAVSIFVGFTPDYVHLLDFESTLQKCGTQFCSEISKTTRLGFSSIMVAQAGVTFVPILVSMPWTLGRIAFFLAEDQENSRSIVTSLTWGTVSAIFRLTLLPLTIAFLYRPSTGTDLLRSTAFWYGIFLLLSSSILVFIVNVERWSDICRCCESRLLRWIDSRNVSWYMVWGWLAFLLPLLKVASISLGEGMWTLWCRLWGQLFSADEWPNTISEFALSDVIVSDLLYLTLSDPVQLQQRARQQQQRCR